jgi:outer membrane protein assembly factor BamB
MVYTYFILLSKNEHKMKKRKLFLSLSGLLFFLFVARPVYADLETPLVVDAASSSNRISYHQVQWYSFETELNTGYCVTISGSENIEPYVLDQNLAVIGEVPEEFSNSKIKKIWVSPSVAGPLHLSVYGVGNPSADYTVQITSAPYLSSIDPTSGCAAVLVTLNGSGFGNSRNNSVVKFGTIRAIDYSSWSDTQIKVYIPSRVAKTGTVPVTVIVGGVSSNALDFSFTVSSQGTMWGYDLGRAGNAPNGPTSFPLVKRWVYKNGGCITTELLYANGDIYFGGYDKNINHTISAVDARTGILKWKTTNENDWGFYTDYSPTYANGKVYFVTPFTILYALDANNGKIIWQYKADKPAGGSPTIIFDDTIYFYSHSNPYLNTKIYAIDVKTGQLKWKRALTNKFIKFAPAVAQGTLYISTSKDIYALDAKTGITKWRRGLSQSNQMVVNNDIVAFYREEMWGGTIFALDAATGKTKWKHLGPQHYYYNFALKDSVIYCYDTCSGYGETLQAFDAKTGKSLWIYEGIKKGEVPPCISNGIIYVDDGNHYYSTKGQLYAISLREPSILWQSPENLNLIKYVLGGKRIFAVNYVNDNEEIICFGQ